MLVVSSNHYTSYQEPLSDPDYADQGPVDNYLELPGPAAGPDGAILRLGRGRDGDAGGIYVAWPGTRSRPLATSGWT